MEPELHNPDESADFRGLRVVAFESRMATETARMIERLGGRAIVAPALREVPLEDNHAALEFAERMLAGQFDMVVFLTGVGVRALFEVMETRHPREALVAALAKTTVVVRGPKPTKASKPLLSGAELKFRIHFPPAASPSRT